MRCIICSAVGQQTDHPSGPVAGADVVVATVCRCPAGSLLLATVNHWTVLFQRWIDCAWRRWWEFDRRFALILLVLVWPHALIKIGRQAPSCHRNSFQLSCLSLSPLFGKETIGGRQKKEERIRILYNRKGGGRTHPRSLLRNGLPSSSHSEAPLAYVMRSECN